MNELYHWGIKGQKWGDRRFQNYDGSLTTAGRLRYGVGYSVRGGVFDSSNTVAKRAKRLGKFGVELAKAKSYQYKNSGRYKFRQAKSNLARTLRGEKANRKIKNDSRARTFDYMAARHQAQFYIKQFGSMAADSVARSSDQRFMNRISTGRSYINAKRSLSLDEFYRGASKLGKAKGAVMANILSNDYGMTPNISRTKKLIKGSARLSRWS